MPKISALDPGATPTGAEIHAVVQSGSTVRLTTNEMLANYVANHMGSIGLHLANDGTSTGFFLKPFKGNSIPVYNFSTAVWELHTFTSSLTGNVSNIMIDGVPNQAIAANTVYDVFLTKTGSTIQFDLSAIQGAIDEPTIGIKVLGGNSKEPLVGRLIKVNGTIQGGASSELLISWYVPGTVALTSTPSGNTGGSLNTWVEMNSSARIQFLSWAEALPLSTKFQFNFQNSVAGTQMNVGVGLYTSPTAANTTPDRVVSINVPTGTVEDSLSLSFSLNGGATGGYYEYRFFAKTDAGTMTLNPTNNSHAEAVVWF